MPVYLCRWPNGDVSLVEAADPDEAAIVLDEFGDADEAELRELDNLLVNFRLEDDGSLQVDQWGGLARQELFEAAYPGLEAALDREFAEGWEPDERPIPERIRAAVEHERERLSEGLDEDEKPQARTEFSPRRPGRRDHRAVGGGGPEEDEVEGAQELTGQGDFGLTATSRALRPGTRQSGSIHKSLSGLCTACPPCWSTWV